MVKRQLWQDDAYLSSIGIRDVEIVAGLELFSELAQRVFIIREDTFGDKDFSKQLWRGRKACVIVFCENPDEDWGKSCFLLPIKPGASVADLNFWVGHAFQLLELEWKNASLHKRLEQKNAHLSSIISIGKALAARADFDFLLEKIIEKAREMLHADGGSIYVVEKPQSSKEEPTHLRFMKSDLSLGLDEFLLPINSSSIAGYVAETQEILVIDDVHKLEKDTKYSFNPEFDKAHNYHTKSMLVIPMTNVHGKIIGVIQLINRKRDFRENLTIERMRGDGVISFDENDLELAEAISGQAAVAIENQRLLESHKELLESIIRLIANAIDSKSEYTGGHCRRVPELTEMIAKEAIKSKDGKFADFKMTKGELYELQIAAWLHDCGKIVTPVHVMDKSTKLETIFDRIELVKARFEILCRDAEIEKLHKISEGVDRDIAEKQFQSKLEKLKEDWLFIENINIGGEFLFDEDELRVKQIANYKITVSNEEVSMLDDEFIKNLLVSRGTLTEEERIVINCHIVETIRMLKALPLPANLQKIPEYAGCHHEKMDGTGYPRGLYGPDISMPARFIVIADIFEALTAKDRPYKDAKPLSESMQIMGKMKKMNHFDSELFDFFVSSGVYRKYAKKHLEPHLIDFVDEEALLAIKPEPYDLPLEAERKKRLDSFLPKYQEK